jgi:signal transduction histidine kinase
VTVRLSETGNYIRITISDTGIGMDKEIKAHLFEKFMRSKETSQMVVGGAGLGLYVGKNFIDAHRGHIWAESEGPGKGSTFIIELPRDNSALLSTGEAQGS